MRDNTQIKQPYISGVRSPDYILKRLSQKDVLLPFLFTYAGVLFWVVSLPGIKLSRMNDLGLISVMTPGCFIALILLSIGFALVMLEPKPVVPLAVLQLVVLLFVQHGLPALIEPLARFGPSWRHVGVIDYIMRNGTVNPLIDAYFNWPGFFGLGALLTQAAGLPDASPFLPWTSLVFELLYMGPLWMIYTSLSDDRRLAWAGLWIFALSNWVGQDYFSPQGLNFFFYLVLLAILLKWFKTSGLKSVPAFLKRFLQKVAWVNRFVERLMLAETIPSQAATPVQQSLLMLTVVVLYVAIISSHQLTPFAVLLAVIALVVIQRLSPPSLPILMLVLLGTWISYMTSSFMNSRIETMLGQAGKVEDMIGANLVNRMAGSSGHLLVVRVRMLLTGGLWLKAVFGGVRRWRAGYTDTIAIALALSPFLLVGLQAYGGEMLLRVFLFSLPFTSFLAAGIYFPKPDFNTGWRTAASFGLVTAVMAFGFFFVRFGNERMESFTLAEKEAIEYVYRTVPEGSLLASSTSHMPYKYTNYEKYRYALLDTEILTGDLEAIISKMGDSRNKAAYLIITRAQKAQLEMFNSFSSANFKSFEQALMASGRFKLVFSNVDAEIYQLVPKGKMK